MNRILRISLLLVVGFAIGRLSHEGSASAQVADRPPPCQDVNDDGVSNLADAVFLLSWLFGGGIAPECPTNGESAGLPDTGQTICYDQAGNEIPCNDNTCAGQDGVYATGCPSEGRFVANGNGTVTDTCTGLMWQQDTADVNDDGEISARADSEDRVRWCEALAYCENLELGGHDDWRLPNVRELQSIVDYGRAHSAIDPVFDTSPFFWSSTPSESVSDSRWGISFHVGSTHSVDASVVHLDHDGISFVDHTVVDGSRR